MSSGVPSQNDFWCHQCRARMRPLPGPRCPSCQGDFVEEIFPGAENPEGYFIQEDEEDALEEALLQPGGVLPNGQPNLNANPMQGLMQALQNLQNQVQVQNQAIQMQRLQQQQRAAGAVPQNAQQAPPPHFNLFYPPQGVNPNAPMNPNAQPFVPPNNANQPPRAGAVPGMMPGFPFGQGIQIQIQDGRGPPRIVQLPMNDLFGALGMGNVPHGNLADYGFGRSMQDIITQIMNQTQHQGAPPASKNAVANLKKVKISKEDVEKKVQCAVCMVDFEENEEVTKLPCEHPFHDGCIKPWLDSHNSCPVCRFELPTDDADYENRRQMRTSQGNGQNPNLRTTTGQGNNGGGNSNPPQ